MKQVEIEVQHECAKGLEIGDRFLWQNSDNSRYHFGTVCRIIDEKVFAQMDKDYIIRFLDCKNFISEDRKPAHPKTGVFV